MVMHIILGILKVLGILLLILLLLVLLNIAIVLLVPFRYMVSADKNGSFRAQTQVTWMWRVFYLNFLFQNGKPSLVVKFLWKTLKEINPPASNTKAPPETEADYEEPYTEEEDLAEPETTEQGSTEWDITEQDIAKPDVPALEQSGTQTAPQAGSSADALSSSAKKAEKKRKIKQPKKPKQPKEKKPSFLLKLSRTVSEIPEKICDAVTKAYDAADRADEGIYELSKKVDSITGRIHMFTDQRSMIFYRVLIRRLIRMARHYRVRRIDGEVHFGTGSPDVTGWLLGVVYCMLPVSAGNNSFIVEPDFYEAVFEGQFQAKGHVRLCHAAAVVIPVLVNRQFYTLLKKIKKVRRGE